MSAAQELLDAFYFRHGPCCAGCDFWCSVNGVAGECQQSAIMSADDRLTMLGISRMSASANVGSGHALTKRDHHCGKFQDSFDWSSLPLAYRKKIGAPVAPTPRNR